MQNKNKITIMTPLNIFLLSSLCVSHFFTVPMTLPYIFFPTESLSQFHLPARIICLVDLNMVSAEIPELDVNPLHFPHFFLSSHSTEMISRKFLLGMGFFHMVSTSTASCNFQYVGVNPSWLVNLLCKTKCKYNMGYIVPKRTLKPQTKKKKRKRKREQNT